MTMSEREAVRPFVDLLCAVIIQAASDALTDGDEGREARAWLRTGGAAAAAEYLDIPRGVLSEWRPPADRRYFQHAQGGSRRPTLRVRGGNADAGPENVGYMCVGVANRAPSP